MKNSHIATSDKIRSKSFDDINGIVLTRSVIYKYGLSVFEDSARFDRWMRKENRVLANKRPVDILNTASGMIEVRNLLGRIAHGVYS